jgi:hypothetical protein
MPNHHIIPYRWYRNRSLPSTPPEALSSAKVINIVNDTAKSNTSRFRLGMSKNLFFKRFSILIGSGVSGGTNYWQDATMADDLEDVLLKIGF